MAAVQFTLDITDRELTLIPVLSFERAEKHEVTDIPEDMLDGFKKFGDNEDFIASVKDTSLKPIILSIADRAMYVQAANRITSDEFKVMKDSFAMMERVERKLIEKLRLDDLYLGSSEVTAHLLAEYLIRHVKVIGGTIKRNKKSGTFIIGGKRQRMKALSDIAGYYAPARKKVA